jgi:hypothetical protein
MLKLSWDPCEGLNPSTIWGLAYLDNGRCRLVSRNGHAFALFAELGSSIARHAEAVANCADCGSAICSDCLFWCCGDSFCEQCSDFHVTYACLKKPVQNAHNMLSTFRPTPEIRQARECSSEGRSGTKLLATRRLHFSLVDFA